MSNCRGPLSGQTGKDRNADTIERFQLTSNTIDGWEQSSLFAVEK